jgi:hypothetical protein
MQCTRLKLKRELLVYCMHCNENPIYVFLFWELHGLSPNFHIHVSVSDLYIPRINSTYCIWLQQNTENRQTDSGYINLSQIYECSGGGGAHNNIILFWK